MRRRLFLAGGLLFWLAFLLAAPLLRNLAGCGALILTNDDPRASCATRQSEGGR